MCSLSPALSVCCVRVCCVQNDPRVLKHELRQVKIRLRESQATGEEQSQLNVEHAKEIQQQRVYCKRMEERWSEMEIALLTIAENMRLKMPTPVEIAATAAAATANGASSASAAAPSALAASSNPVLRVLASRWAALTGRPTDEMSGSLKTSDDAHATKSPTATGDEMTDEAAPDAADDADDDDDPASKDPRAAFSSENVKLEQSLQQMLQQRAAFTQAILATVVSNLPAVVAPVAPTDLSAQVLALQAERAALQTRLHSAENEVQLLSTTLSEHDALLEAEKEKNKSLRRKLERMQVDLESGDLRKAAAASSSSGAAAAAAPGENESKDGGAPSGPRLGMEGAESVMLDSVPDTRPLSPTSLTKFAVPVSAPAASSSSSHRYSDQDWRTLKEDMLEFKSLAKHRLEEIHALNKEKSALELDVKKARLAVLEDEAAIRNTKIFQELKNSYANLNKYRLQLTQRAEAAEQQAAEDKAALRALKAEFDRQMAESQLQSDAAVARFTASITELRSQIHQLEQHNAELSTELPKHPDFAFYQHLRTELLPSMDAALKQQAAAIAQRDTEKKLRESVAASAEEAAADASKQEFGRVLRIWKDQQRKLEAEKTALQEEVNRLRAAATPAAGAASLSSSSAASAAEVSELRVKLAAATHEAASLRTDLTALQSAPSDVSTLQSELVSLQEMNATFGQELNDMSSSVDAATATAARLTAQIVASTATLDKMRSERVAAAQRQASVRNEPVLLKHKLDASELAVKQAKDLVAALQAQIQALTKEAQKSHETQRVMQQLLDQARDSAGLSNQAASAPASSSGAASSAADAASASESIIASLTAAKVSSALEAQKAHESVKLLKGRLERALKESGSRKGGAGGGAGGSSSSADADRIKSLKLQLTCQVCETNEKDRIITKCMHMLCNGCVKANLEVRRTQANVEQPARNARDRGRSGSHALCSRCALSRLASLACANAPRAVSSLARMMCDRYTSKLLAGAAALPVSEIREFFHRDPFKMFVRLRSNV